MKSNKAFIAITTSIVAVILITSVLIVLVLTGRLHTSKPKEEQTTAAPVTTQINPQYEKLLREAYTAQYSAETSGRLIRDLNADGVPEMIVGSFEQTARGWITAYTVSYYKISNDAALLTDRFTVDNDRFDHFFFVYDGEDETYTGEALQICANDAGYILCNFYTKVDNTVESFLLLHAENDTLQPVQHLWDPGYTSGFGIYTYEGYHSDDYGNGILFELGTLGEEDRGKYSSCQAALDGELGVYGFTFGPLFGKMPIGDTDQKNQTLPSDTVTQLLFYRTGMCKE